MFGRRKFNLRGLDLSWKTYRKKKQQNKYICIKKFYQKNVVTDASDS